MLSASLKKLIFRFFWVLVLTLLLMRLSADWYTLKKISVSFDAESEVPLTYQAFWTQEEREGFSQKHAVMQRVPAGERHVNIVLPAEHVERFRLDIGTVPGRVTISSMELRGKEKTFAPDLNKFRYVNINEHHIAGNSLVINSRHPDPYITYQEPVKLDKPFEFDTCRTIICGVICALISCMLVYYYAWEKERLNKAAFHSIGALQTTLSTKDRMVAPDIVRLLAAFGIMYVHLAGLVSTPMLKGIVRWSYLFGSADALFFILSGFFACRNISWKKAVNNAKWCFLAFVLWNFVAWISFSEKYPLPPFHECFGMSHILLSFIPFIKTSDLANLPLWYMRDLVFLFLLSPLLAKYARYIFPTLLLLSVVPQCAGHFEHTEDIHQVCMRPYTLAYFSAGCFIAGLHEDVKKKVFSYYSTWFIVLYLIATGVSFYYLKWGGEYPFLRGLFGMWVLYQIARWMEVHVPGIKTFAIKLAGPTTFLAYAAHTSFNMIWVPSLLQAIGCKEFVASHSWLVLTYPFLVFGLMTAFFLAMKRWCRPLLHLVCYYKLRPDDLAPANGGK